MNNSYDNLDLQDVNVISSLQRRISTTIENINSDINYMTTILNQYNAYMQKTVECSLQEVNIIKKYNSEPLGSTYNLPGVFAPTVASYDLEAMKQDNELLKSVIDSKEKTEKQRNTSFSIITQAYNDLKQKLNMLAQDNQQIIQYMEGLKEDN